MPKISIIIPVYNTEKYLAKCLESLINQTFSDIEIICVDDGSIDNSLKILEEYSQKDERIKVFLQENQGPGVARNLALKNAKGEYIMFCDSDDFYEPQMCKKMFNTIEENNVDLVECNSNVIKDDCKRDVCVPNYCQIKYVGEQNITEKIKYNVTVVLWNKIFKKSLIDKYDIKFVLFHRAEDNAFIYEYLAVSKKIFFLDEKLYNYVLRSNSIMDIVIQKEESNKKYDFIYTFYEVLKFFIKNNLWKENSSYFFNVFYDNYYFRWQYLDKKEVKKSFEIIKECLKDVEISNPKSYSERFFYEIKKNNFRKAENFLLKNVSFLQQIFSLKNQGNHKVLRILGIKIKFRRKK